MVGEFEDVLAVPVQAVTEQKGRHYAFVKSGDEFEVRKVKVGNNNDKFIEITSGLSEGDEITLDARERALEAIQKDQDAFKPDSLTEDEEEADQGEEDAMEEKASDDGKAAGDEDVTKPEMKEGSADKQETPKVKSEVMVAPVTMSESTVMPVVAE